MITEETGERRSLHLNAYSDPGLLAEGKSEWAVAAGAPSYLLDNQRTYSSGDYMGSGFFRYGFSDDLTVEADLQADVDVIMAGFGADVGTAFGVFGLHGAGSSSDAGEGVAVDADWSLINFSLLTDTREESVHLSAEYRSEAFHTPGEFLSDKSGILYPEFNYWLRLNASYSVPLFDDVTATASARYQFDDEERVSASRYRIVGDRYGADITLSSPIGPSANASVSAGYSNELYTRDLEERVAADPEFRAGFRINWRPDDTTSIAAGYDTLGQQATLSAYKSEGSGIGRWDTSVDIQARGYQETGSISASAGYYGNRAELRLSHYADSDSFDVANIADTTTRQRTSVRVGTAIAFAGDKVAVGAPVRGDAFAILAPHESLGDTDVIGGHPDSARAIADQWGNGLIGDVPAYLPSSTAIDVADLPLGYSLGSGAFDTNAPYKAGHVFRVGSANSISVYGTLQAADGQPLGLITGTARPVNGQGEAVAVFTNAEGRFGAEGMGPGRWVIEMAGEAGPVRYVIDIPDNASGLVKTGTLRPGEGEQP